MDGVSVKKILVSIRLPEILTSKVWSDVSTRLMIGRDVYRWARGIWRWAANWLRLQSNIVEYLPEIVCRICDVDPVDVSVTETMGYFLLVCFKWKSSISFFRQFEKNRFSKPVEHDQPIETCRIPVGWSHFFYNCCEIPEKSMFRSLKIVKYVDNYFQNIFSWTFWFIDLKNIRFQWFWVSDAIRTAISIAVRKFQKIQCFNPVKSWNMLIITSKIVFNENSD